MKKRPALSLGRKIAMIATITAVVIIVTLLLAMFIGYANEKSKFTPAGTGEVTDGIYVIRTDFVSFYAFETDGKYVLFDTGTDQTLAKAGLDQLNIDPVDVIAVFLTHGHHDHTGSVGLYTNAEHYIYDGRAVKNINTNPLADGQTVTVGNLTVKSVLTPGHTDLSTCFLVNSTHLLVGDTLSLKDGKAELFNSWFWFFNKSNAKQRVSLHELAQIDSVTHILSAHYGYTGNAAALKAWK